MAVPRGEAEIGELPTAERRERAALPGSPAAAAIDRDGERRPEPRHARDDAAGRRLELHVDIELVVVRNRVDAQPQAIAAGDALAAERGGVGD